MSVVSAHPSIQSLCSWTAHQHRRFLLQNKNKECPFQSSDPVSPIISAVMDLFLFFYWGKTFLFFFLGGGVRIKELSYIHSDSTPLLICFFRARRHSSCQASGTSCWQHHSYSGGPQCDTPNYLFLP